ncbi:MAG: glycosyltransferase [Parabacteroides sp.]|nr:glycosyltransferase [Parabacteroides sp.]
MDTVISIIVPIYNAEKFLAPCIDSILSQTFQDFELLLVDDGSQDASFAICQRYQQNDNRITAFHKSNEGVTATRKYGVEKAKGKYICFVDADDVIPENSLTTLLDNGNDADIIVGSYREINGEEEHDNVISTDIPEHLSGLDYIGFQLENKLYHAPWGKLFKKECFNHMTFDIPRSIFRGEDYIMNIRLGIEANNITIVKKVVYHYIIRNSSCMQTLKPSLEYEKLFDANLIRPLIDNNLYQSMKSQIPAQRLDAVTGLLKDFCHIQPSFVCFIDRQERSDYSNQA